MFTAIIYKQTITAKTMRGLKMLASKMANRYRNSIDEMFVTGDGFNQTYKYIRINKKCPNGTIAYGQWK